MKWFIYETKKVKPYYVPKAIGFEFTKAHLTTRMGVVYSLTIYLYSRFKQFIWEK